MISTRVPVTNRRPMGLITNVSSIITPPTTTLGTIMLHTVRLTVDNISDELLPGDRFADDPAFGTIRSARAGRGSNTGNGRIFNTDGWSDVIGLPQTVTIIRDETPEEKILGDLETQSDRDAWYDMDR